MALVKLIIKKTNQELKDGSYKRKTRDIYKGKYKRDKEH